MAFYVHLIFLEGCNNIILIGLMFLINSKNNLQNSAADIYLHNIKL